MLWQDQNRARGRMKQSPRMSFYEATANVVIGYGLALATQILVFPVFGLIATFDQNLKLGLVFTGVSLMRSFVMRRLFETLRVRTR